MHGQIISDLNYKITKNIEEAQI